jgi:outer membrane lipoprotein-sorting protein
MIVACSLLVATSAWAQSVDEIVARNVEAKGGLERLRAVQTVKQTSKLTMSNSDMTLIVYAKRPNLVRQEITIVSRAGGPGPQKVINSYDGKTAWMINPMAGSTSPIAVMGPQADAIREQSDFDGPLVDYKTRGYRLDFVGTETVNGRRAHHLRLTDRAKRVQHLYLDAETGLESKIIITTDNGSVEQELTDYRDVEGVKVPFSIRTTANGVQQSVLTIEKVEFNVKIDDAIFKLGRP